MAGPAHKERKIFREKTLPDYSLQDGTTPSRNTGYGHTKLEWQRYQNAKRTTQKTS